MTHATKTYNVRLFETEMLLVLRALNRKSECTDSPVAADYKRLHDHLERIYEERE